MSDMKSRFDEVVFDGDGNIVEVIDHNSVSHKLQVSDHPFSIIPITKKHERYPLYVEGENENRRIWYRLGSGRSESYIPVRVVDHPARLLILHGTSIAVALKAQNSDKVITAGESETFASAAGTKLGEMRAFASPEEIASSGCPPKCQGATYCNPNCCLTPDAIDAVREAYRTTSSLEAAAYPLLQELPTLTEAQAHDAATRIIGIASDPAAGPRGDA